MDVVDELASARAAYEEGQWTAAFSAWSAVGDADLEATDLRAVATVAFLLGDQDRSIQAWQRAHHRFVDQGDVAGAVRCSFHLAMTFGTGGEAALFNGWLGRTQRLVDAIPPDPSGMPPVEAGYLAMLNVYGGLLAGDFVVAAGAAKETAAIGRSHHDADLVALGLCAQGRMELYAGRVAQGFALLDEAMVGVFADELGTLVAGHVYCTAIEGCQEIGDTGRTATWTSALHRWCTDQPGLVAFTGQCAVHRGQILTLRGAWSEALAEFDAARHRYRASGSPGAIGLTERERGDVLRLRGELDAADAAYQEAARGGCDPQPGLALLWLEQGSTQAAVEALERALNESQGPVPRCRLLPAVVEVMLEGGRPTNAQEAAAELAGLAAAFGVGPVSAAAADARARVELASGDPAGALPYARKSAQVWASVDCPFGVARARLLVGVALAELTDEESSRHELASARAAFAELGALPSVRAVERLLSPGSYPGGLTPREVEVLALVASGRSNAQIAEVLVVSNKTVARHLSNIFTKLEVGSRTAAAAYAFEHRLV